MLLSFCSELQVNETKVWNKKRSVEAAKDCGKWAALTCSGWCQSKGQASRQGFKCVRKSLLFLCKLPLVSSSLALVLPSFVQPVAPGPGTEVPQVDRNWTDTAFLCQDVKMSSSQENTGNARHPTSTTTAINTNAGYLLIQSNTCARPSSSSQITH